MDDLLPEGGAVQIGRLVQIVADAGNGRQINHGAVAGGLPEVHDGNQDVPDPRRFVVVELVHAQREPQAVDKTVGVEQGEADSTYQHHGHEVRQKHQRLAGLFEKLGAHLRQHDGESDPKRCADDDENDVIQKRICRKRPRRAGGEKKLEVIQPHKAAAEQTLAHVVVGEGIINADHGQIIEHQKERDAGNHHHQQHGILFGVITKIAEKPSLSQPVFLGTHISTSLSVHLIIVKVSLRF